MFPSFFSHFICNDMVGAAVGLTEGLAVGFAEGSTLGLTVLASVDGLAVGLHDGRDDDGTENIKSCKWLIYKYDSNVTIALVLLN